MNPASQPLPELPAAPSSGDAGGSLALLHPDIIRVHILSRLDGPSLASTACASYQLCSLSSEDELWQDICAVTWPSTAEPGLHNLISGFRSGFRSFYSDAYPLLPSPHVPNHPLPPSPRTIAKLISAIDIFYGDELLFSKVQETECSSPLFMSAPFRIDLIEAKEPLKTAIPFPSQSKGNLLKHLQENLKLSWIVIDPISKRAVSLPSPRPISVGQDWLNGGIQVRFSSILGVAYEEFEFVECRASLACSEDVDGKMEVREISLRMEDTEGRGVNGEGSVSIIAAAMDSEKRRPNSRRRGGGITMQERFEEFGEMKRKKRQKHQRRDRALDMACMGGGIAITAGFLLWLHALFQLLRHGLLSRVSYRTGARFTREHRIIRAA